MARKYSRRRASAKAALGKKGKDVRRYKKSVKRGRKKARKELLNVGSDVRYPKWFRKNALTGARRIK